VQARVFVRKKKKTFPKKKNMSSGNSTPLTVAQISRYKVPLDKTAEEVRAMIEQRYASLPKGMSEEERLARREGELADRINYGPTYVGYETWYTFSRK
jgi:hypothetical protein